MRGPSAVRSHVCTRQTGSSRSNVYGSTDLVVGVSSPSLRYSISTTCRFSTASDSVRTSRSSSSAAVPAGARGTSNWPKVSSSLRAHPVERRAGVRRDRRADVVDREADGARLEGRELRRSPEDVAVQLLVDPHDAVFLVDLRVDRVAAPAEVDEIEQGERFLELFARDREARGELVGVEPGVAASRRMP